MDMDPLPMLLIRQQRLEFANDDQWKKLPPDAQAQCQQHVSRLLILAITFNRRERESENEREDSI